MEYDVAIVGGGASALAAAITLGRRGKKVALLERSDRVGKKILQTGNGRCNITNKNLSLKKYHGKNPAFAMSVLDRVGYDETEAFFKSIGIIFAEERGGKMFPMSFQASCVLDLLRCEISRLGIGEITDFFVTKIKKNNGLFEITAQDGKKITAARVIIATGGMAAPQDGSDGNGYRLLESFGHKLIKTAPSLVQLKATAPFRALKGVKQDGRVTAYVSGKACRTEQGEVLFTDYGISGPPVFNISQPIAEALEEGKRAMVEINFLPYMEKTEAAQLIMSRKQDLPQLWGEDFLNGIVNKRLGRQIMKGCKTVDEVIDSLLGFKIEISGTMSYRNAQATTGGIDTADFDADTMESYLESGLYAAGEVLDVVGDCGGYNLQWAWSSGIVAGEAAAE